MRNHDIMSEIKIKLIFKLIFIKKFNDRSFIFTLLLFTPAKTFIFNFYVLFNQLDFTYRA